MTWAPLTVMYLILAFIGLCLAVKNRDAAPWAAGAVVAMLILRR